jgi:hypothetical protein
MQEYPAENEKGGDHAHYQSEEFPRLHGLRGFGLGGFLDVNDEFVIGLSLAVVADFIEVLNVDHPKIIRLTDSERGNLGVEVVDALTLDLEVRHSHVLAKDGNGSGVRRAFAAVHFPFLGLIASGDDYLACFVN